MSSPGIPSFDDYLSNLGRLSVHADPTVDTPEKQAIKLAYMKLGALSTVDIASVTAWVKDNPRDVPVLGLTVGLSHEGLKNAMNDKLGTSGWVNLGAENPEAIVRMLDDEFDLIRLLGEQRFAQYNFGDILIARGSTRGTAVKASTSGRSVEDAIEVIAQGLGLSYATRTRFTGRRGATAPCDLVVPASGSEALIAVAAKGYDSTGSKLTDTVREIQEMAEIRRPQQYIMAVIDGIGWKSRQADLRRIYDLWASDQIDGMYTLATLDQFRDDLRDAARLRKLLP